VLESEVASPLVGLGVGVVGAGVGWAGWVEVGVIRLLVVAG